MRKLFIHSVGILFISCVSAASAQTSEQDAVTPPNIYQVELLIFRNLDQSKTTPEILRLPEPELSEELDTELARLRGDSGEAATTSSALESPQAAEWQAADPDNRLLAGTASSIRNLQAYELLTYLSWAQTAPDVAVAKPIGLADLGVNPAILKGEVELYQRRYLHLAVDVALVDGKTQAAPAGAEIQFPAAGLTLPAIKDSRRIRLENLQYFDQPDFGIIAVVSRFEPANNDPG